MKKKKAVSLKELPAASAANVTDAFDSLGRKPSGLGVINHSAHSHLGAAASTDTIYS